MPGLEDEQLSVNVGSGSLSRDPVVEEVFSDDDEEDDDDDDDDDDVGIF